MTPPPMPLVAGACVAGTVWVVLPARHTAAGTRRRLFGTPAGSRGRWHPAMGPVGWISAVALVGFTVVGVVPSLLLVLGAGVLTRRTRDAANRQVAGRRRQQTTRLCSALAAELQTGAPPTVAFARVADDAGDLCPAAAAAARHGADVSAALRASAGAPGAEGLRWLAACWDTTTVLGAALGPPVTRLADGLEQAEQHRREVAAELAGPRATARLLAGLPAVGVLLGVALGADPLGVLLDTTYGTLCLVAGVGLAFAGLIWVDHLARRAEAAL